MGIINYLKYLQKSCLALHSLSENRHKRGLQNRFSSSAVFLFMNTYLLATNFLSFISCHDVESSAFSLSRGSISRSSLFFSGCCTFFCCWRLRSRGAGSFFKVCLGGTEVVKLEFWISFEIEFATISSQLTTLHATRLMRRFSSKAKALAFLREMMTSLLMSGPGA